MSKTITLAKTPLKHIPANDNAIDIKDVPIADRAHWLGEIERGSGYRTVESHPYRSRVKYGRDASGKWDFETPLPVQARQMPRSSGIAWLDAELFATGEIDGPESARITLARKAAHAHREEMPQRYRLAVRANIGAKDASRELLEQAKPLLASKEERKWAGEGMPIEAEFRTGRIGEKLRGTASDFADVYETANTESSAISDRRIDARSAASFLRYRLMHLWRPIVDALVFGKTMAAIGREYGGNKEDSAKLGRQKVVDGLLIAHECFADLRDMKARERKAESEDAHMDSPHVTTLGRKSGGLPISFHKAANDNRKAIRSVA